MGLEQVHIAVGTDHCMRYFALITFLLCALSAFAQPLPMLRSPWTTNSPPTNAWALRPTFYGKVGIGTASPFAAATVEIRDGTSDQRLIITREQDSYYANFELKTFNVENWQIGLRAGDSNYWIFNPNNSSYVNINHGGVLDVFNSSTAPFQDNSINIQNRSGGFSSVAMYRPADGGLTPQTAAAVAIGFGPLQPGVPTLYAGRAYLGLNPSNALGVVPDFLISQEQTNSAGSYMAHTRLWFQRARIDMLNWTEGHSTGSVSQTWWPNGDTTLGTSTNRTTNAGPFHLGDGSGTFILSNNPTVTNLSVRPAAQAAGLGLTIGPGGNVGVNTNAPQRPLDIAGTMVAGMGTASQPTYAANGTTNTGWYFPSANQVASTHAGLPGVNIVGETLFRMRNTMALAWASGDPTTQNADTSIIRPVPGALVLTNLGTSAGAVLGGTIAASNQVRASAGLSATNLATNNILAHTLTNNNDAVVYEAFGQMSNLLPGTNRFAIVYGSQTILDTGAQTWSNTTYRVRATIVRTGNTAQAYNAEFEVGGVPVGSPFVLTNSAGTTVQTNGINTLLVLQTTSSANGALTNFANRLKLEPYTQ